MRHPPSRWEPEYQLTPEDIKEFQKAIRKDYGVRLSEKTAIKTAKCLIWLYELIAHPLPNNKKIPKDGARRESSGEIPQHG